jgi:two-component sensor histidine kinase
MSAGTGTESTSPLFESISNPLLDAILTQAPVGITIATAPDVEIVRVSQYGVDLLGRDRGGLENISASQHATAYQVYDPKTLNLADAEQLPLTRAIASGEIVQGEEWLVANAAGALVPIMCHAGPIRDVCGRILGGLVAWVDVSKQKQLEARLRDAIAERDAARAELAHRVRNHLMLITGMLEMESLGKGEAAETVADSVGAKITALGRAYAVVEGRSSNDAPAIDLLQAITAPLGTRRVNIVVKADPDHILTAEQCAPFGIIVNEVVCNALKHGFGAGQSGTISVELAPVGDNLELLISNDGSPMNTDSNRAGGGTRFIAALVRQLRGTMTLANSGDGRVVMRLVFPNLQMESNVVNAVM